MKAKYLVIVVIAIIFTTVGFSFYARGNVLVEKINLSNLTSVITFDEVYNLIVGDYAVLRIYNDDVETVDDLKSSADVIAKVKLVNRKQEVNTLISEVEVLEIYKGDINLNNTISIYEPMSINENILLLNSIMLPLQANQEYVVFLNNILETNKQKYNYISQFYGKYNTNQDMFLHMQQEDDVAVATFLIYDFIFTEVNEEEVLNYYDTSDHDKIKEGIHIYNKTIEKYLELSNQIRGEFR